MSTVLWVCMRRHDPPVEACGCLHSSEINGIFDTRDGAVRACTVSHDCIFQINLNERLPEELVVIDVEWPLASGDDGFADEDPQPSRVQE